MGRKRLICSGLSCISGALENTTGNLVMKIKALVLCSALLTFSLVCNAQDKYDMVGLW